MVYPLLDGMIIKVKVDENNFMFDMVMNGGQNNLV